MDPARLGQIPLAGVGHDCTCDCVDSDDGDKMTRETHKKNFPVGKMPWHTDGHKFGESQEDASVEEKDVINIFRSLDGTISFAEDGVCSVCSDWAVYVFKGKLYCTGCWLAWDEDHG